MSELFDLTKFIKKLYRINMTFFSEDNMQRIRYLHFSIKKIEEALEKEDEQFTLDDLNLILEYTKILNVNYKNENHQNILRDLDITSTFLDPLNKKEIEIKDMMFECSRALWVMAKAYSQLSEKYEEEANWENAVIAIPAVSSSFTPLRPSTNISTIIDQARMERPPLILST